MLYGKNALILLALTKSAVVFSGDVGSMTNSQWSFGGSALYLQPSIGNNALASETVSSERIPSNTNVFGVKPDYSWGFYLEGAFQPTSDSNLEINWYHLRSADNTSRYLNEPGDWIAPFGLHTQQLLLSGNATFNNKSQWDAVNLEYGWRFHFKNAYDLRLHGGGQYARITNFSSFYGLTNNGVVGFRTFNFNTSYNGFGPRVGAYMVYHFANGVGVYAKGAAAVLAGSNKYDANLNNYANGNYATKNTNVMTVVPEIDGKLGVEYSYLLNRGVLVIDAGWLWVNYFDALTSPSIQPLQGNFGVQGVYFGLKWNGTIA